jgi:hypothetical protein
MHCSNRLRASNELRKGKHGNHHRSACGNLIDMSKDDRKTKLNQKSQEV